MSEEKIPEVLLRGVVSVTTEKELAARLELGRPLRVKLGVDPTTKDLHLGHTVCLRKMRAFQEYGHTAVLIIGDFTGMIGDPSGRTDIRKPLSRKQIEDNAATYQEQAFKILDPKKTEVRHNSEWLDPFISSGKMLDYLPQVTHAKLTEREDFQKRITENKPITMLELMYPVFQGYDSVAVKADVELGGTDQTFNLLFGRDMQKDFDQEPQVTLTMPILVGTDGVRKMSKSYGNYVGITDLPNDMFGKIMSVSDETMLQWAEILTGLDLDKVRSLHPMEAKKKLAKAIVASFHGDEMADSAKKEFESVHGQGNLPQDIKEFALPKERKLYLSQVLHLAGLAPTRKEAQRKIKEGGVRLDGQTVADDKIFELDKPCVLSLGSRQFCRVVP